MWLIVLFISAIIWVYCELVGKYIVTSYDQYVPLKMRIISIMLGFAVVLLFSLFRIEGNHPSLWKLFFQNPLIICTVTCNILSGILYLYGLRYVGLAIEEALIACTGPLLFVGMVFFNLFTGKLSTIGEMLQISYLIPLLLIFLGVVLLPYADNFIKRSSSENEKKNIQPMRLKIVVGLLIIFLGLICDVGDSLLTAIVLSDGSIGFVDFTIICYFIAPFWGICLYILLWTKMGKPFLPFKKENRSLFLYGTLYLCGVILYLFGVSLDATRFSIIWTIYPIFPIICARIFLKEKYSMTQYCCIAVIVLAAIAFCLTDALN